MNHDALEEIPKAEHQHGGICDAVMKIRSTTVDEGVLILEALLKNLRMDDFEDGMAAQVEFDRPHRLTCITNLRSELLRAVENIGEGGCNCSSCETWRSDFRAVIERVLPAKVKR